MLMTPCRWCCALSLLVAVAGCGGGSSPSGAAPTAPAAAPGPPPPPTVAGTGEAIGAAGEIPAWAGQRNDEPFDVKAFLASRVAPPDNAAPLYMTALASISGELGDPSAAALEKEIGELASFDRLTAGSISPQQIDQVLAKAAPAIRLIDAAQAKPRCLFVTGLGIDALLPHAQSARTVTRLTVLQLQQARNTGDFPPAEAAVNRTLRLSRDLQPRGPLVCQLVSIAMDGVTFTGIERLVLTRPQLTADECDRFIATLTRHQQQMLSRTEEGLKLEYIMSRNAIDDLQAGRMSLQELLDLGGSEPLAPDSVPSSPAFNYEAEIASLNRLYGLLLADANKPTAPEATLGPYRQEMARLKAEIEKSKAGGGQGPFNQPGFLTHFLVAPIEPVFDANRRTAAQLAGTQMLLALRRYEVAHGSLPADLQTAAAESALKTVPRDPYDGAPLRLAMIGGKPTVYSVGKDLKDDGGQADWKNGQQPGDYLFSLPPRTP